MKYNDIHYTTDHTGKMAGLASLSTSCAMNEICKKRAAVPGSICSHCYAQRLVSFRETLRDALAANTEKLTSEILPVESWPRLNYSVFRFEAFGELNNKTQVINYFNLCKRNPETTFSLWTKNPQFIAAAIDAGHKKPRNLIVIQSSFKLNQPDAPRYSFINKVFTVYDKKHAETVTINCGARNCNECRRCYHKTKKTEYINELLK